MDLGDTAQNQRRAWNFGALRQPSTWLLCNETKLNLVNHLCLRRLAVVSNFGDDGSGSGEIHPRAKFRRDTTRGERRIFGAPPRECLLAGGDFQPRARVFCRIRQNYRLLAVSCSRDLYGDVFIS